MPSSRPGGKAASSRPGKRKGPTDDAGACLGTLLLQPPTTRVKAGAALSCGRCKETPAKARWAFFDDAGACLGNACRRCWRPYVTGYLSLSWEEHCDKCHSEAEYSDEVEIACAVVADDVVAPWPQSDISDESSFELVTTRSYIGLARSDFTTAAGNSPAELQVAEADLPSESSTVFKGVLMQNPMRPFVQYDVVHRRSLGKAKSLLRLGHDCRAGLAGEVLQEARDTRDKETFFTKLRNCTLTVQALDKKLGKPTFSSLFAVEAGTSASSPGYSGSKASGGASANASAVADAGSAVSPAKPPPPHQAGSPGDAHGLFAGSSMSEAGSASGSVFRRLASRRGLEPSPPQKAASSGMTKVGADGSMEDPLSL